MNSWELPLQRWFEDEIHQAEDPGIQRAPDGIDGGRPIGAEIGIADVKVGYAIGVHGLALDGGVDMQRAEHNGERSAHGAYLRRVSVVMK